MLCPVIKGIANKTAAQSSNPVAGRFRSFRNCPARRYFTMLNLCLASSGLMQPSLPGMRMSRAAIPAVSMIDPIAAVEAASGLATLGVIRGVVQPTRAKPAGTGSKSNDAEPASYDAGLSLDSEPVAEPELVAAAKPEPVAVAPKAAEPVIAAVEDAPPAGFEWGGTFVFEDVTEPVASVKTEAAVTPTPTPAPVAVVQPEPAAAAPVVDAALAELAASFELSKMSRDQVRSFKSSFKISDVGSFTP